MIQDRDACGRLAVVPVAEWGGKKKHNNNHGRAKVACPVWQVWQM